MKVVIISDIKSSAKSVIPYGLRLAKSLKLDVDVIHTIDPRSQQGVSSNYGDSQSITPGNKMSHEEIMNREKNAVSFQLDDILSRESSRLNYPLKVKVQIEEGSIETKVKSEVNKTPSSILVVSKTPDQYIFHTEKEIIDICRIFRGICMIVPPGEEFKEFDQVLLPTNYDVSQINGYQEVAFLINHHKPLVYSVGPSKNGTKERIDQWKKKAETVFSGAKVTCELKGSGNIEDSVDDYMSSNNPDLILLLEQNRNLGFINKSKSGTHKIVKNTNNPILYYSRVN